MFKCKNCGSDMRFDPTQQKLVCRHCGAAVSPHEYKEDRAIHAEERKLSEEEIPYYQNEEAAFSDNNQDTPIFKTRHQKQENPTTYQATLMTCPQCGGQLLTTDETAATFCSFCGSSVLLKSRVSNEQRPDYIIPFRKSKDDCKNAYKKVLRKALYAPSDMLNEEQIEHFRGIYMPYWVYSFRKKGLFQKRGSRSQRRGNYIYTKHYNLRSQVDASYDGLSFDASSSFSDNLSEAIAPFQFSESEPFETGYLSGFYADTSDVHSSVYEEDAKDIAKEHAADQLSRSYTYQKYNVDRFMLKESFPLEAGDPKLAMYPVWFLACRNKTGDRISYAAINGQTGKVAADLPIDKKKMLIGTAILAIPIFLILNLLLTLTPGKALIVTIILGLIGMILANRQMNLIYCFENKLDDKGYMSIHDPWGKNTRKQNSVLPSMGSGTLRTILVIVGSIIIFSLLANFDIPFNGILIFVVMFLLIKNFIKPTKGKKSRKVKLAEKAAPLSDKMKTLWKPIVGIIASLIIVVLAPVSDLYYYGAAIISMVFVTWSFWDILNMHNRLSTRPLPQFNKRGGEEYENV